MHILTFWFWFICVSRYVWSPRILSQTSGVDAWMMKTSIEN